MTQQRMSQASRKSFLRANRAAIYGHGDAWIILLSWDSGLPFSLIEKPEIWTVKGGDDVSVVYSFAHAAAQAIQRVRPDMQWTVHDKHQKNSATPIPSDVPVASIGIKKGQAPVITDPSATNKTFANWLVETTAAAQVAGILDQLPEGVGDIGTFIERLNQLRVELKK